MQHIRVQLEERQINSFTILKRVKSQPDLNSTIKNHVKDKNKKRYFFLY